MSHSTDSAAPALTRSRSTATRKMILSAMFACLAFVLNTFVYFPAMAPFQHFVDVLAAVFVGPWYAFAAALLCGILRMLSGRTIQAVAGAIFGPILGGLLYRKFHNFWVVLLGEVVGTGFVGVHGNLDLDHRQGELLTQHLGRAAPGDHHIVIPAKIALCDLHALFQVSYMQRQVHLRKFFGHPRHHRRDPLIGCDPQDMDVRLHSHSHLSEKAAPRGFPTDPTPSEIVSI